MNIASHLSVITDEISQDLAYALDVAQQFGINVVELRSIQHKNIALFTDDELQALKDVLGKRGMKVNVVSGPFAKCVLPDSRWAKKSGTSFSRNPTYNLGFFDRLAEIATFFGTPFIRVFNFLRFGVGSLETGWVKMKETLCPYIQKAEQLGKILVLENDTGFFADTVARTRRFFEEVRSPALKLNLDPGNFFSVKSPTTPDAYQWFYDQGLVAHMHVKDARRRFPLIGGSWGVVGEGSINYKALFKQAMDSGFKGFFSLETHVLKNKEEKSVKSLHHLTRMLQEL
jgi:sugar phosphate isomerase/epimerase